MLIHSTNTYNNSLMQIIIQNFLLLILIYLHTELYRYSLHTDCFLTYWLAQTKFLHSNPYEYFA